MQSRNSGPMRTVTVARRSGYSVQQIRNLEGDGVLPPAARTDSGYRVYDDRHVRAARAYRALAAAVGPVEAKTIMRTVHAARSPRHWPGSTPRTPTSTANAATCGRPKPPRTPSPTNHSPRSVPPTR